MGRCDGAVGTANKPPVMAGIQLSRPPSLKPRQTQPIDRGGLEPASKVRSVGHRVAFAPAAQNPLPAQKIHACQPGLIAAETSISPCAGVSPM